MEGKKFKHKYLPYLTCVVVAGRRQVITDKKISIWKQGH